MKNSIQKLSRYLIVILLIGVAGCSSDDGTTSMSTMEKLIGTWTTSDVNVDATIDGQSVTDYLVDVGGLTPAEAAAQYAIFQALLESEVTGSLTLNSDNTYVSSFGGGSDSGTWSLSSDGKTLTLFEGTDTIVITVQSVTANLLNVSLGDDILEDIDNDAGTPDVLISVLADVTLVK